MREKWRWKRNIESHGPRL